MRKLSTLAAALLLTSATLGAETRVGYAVQPNGEFSSYDTTCGIYSFDFDAAAGTSGYTLVKELEATDVTSAHVIGTQLYYMTHRNYGYDGTPYFSGTFNVYDIEEGTVRVIADYGQAPVGPAINSMQYNHQDGQMWGMNGIAPTNRLATIDLETGVVTPGARFTFDREASPAAAYDPATTSGFGTINCLAINYDGECYGVSYWGGLYRINLTTGQCTLIADMSHNPEIAFMYIGNSLFFDNDTNELYMHLYTYYNGNEILHINKNTGECTVLNSLDFNTHPVGYSLPFIVAEASAPARVKNLTATPGAQGALSVALAWDNPTTTYGRGATLESITAVKVYRNGELVKTLDAATPGEHMTWTDNTLTERGTYDYRVVAENAAGAGDRASVSVYAGVGDPKAVTDVVTTYDGDNALITWAPVIEGLHGAWIDLNDITYSIKRDGTEIATGLKTATYTDTALDTYAKYTYTVTAHAGGYASEPATAPAVIAGPAYVPEVTFGFNSQEEFDLWSLFDYDGDMNTWVYSYGYYGQVRGAQLNYYYSDYAPEEYIISPDVQLSAGVRYKLTFDAAPGTRNPERLRLEMGSGRLVEDMTTELGILNIDAMGNYRVNLPVLDADMRANMAFVCISEYKNFTVSFGNVVIAEDHEGYISGVIKDAAGNAVKGATVLVNGGQFHATTDAEGKYTLSYLPEGTYTLNVMCLGYYDNSAQATVTQWETTTADITLTPLPEYTLKGKVVDTVGDPVEGATIEITGYNTYSGTTDAAGLFTIPAIYENDWYTLTVSKNKLVTYTTALQMDVNRYLETIVLEDAIRPAERLAVAESEDAATLTLTWDDPNNDPVLFRNDDGAMSNALGYETGNQNSVFGVINRTPSVLREIDFFITAGDSQHWSVYLYVFDLDEQGNPTSNILYENTYVSVTDDMWNTFTLPSPSTAPAATTPP